MPRTGRHTRQALDFMLNALGLQHTRDEVLRGTRGNQLEETVMARGGFHGLDPILTPEKLARMGVACIARRRSSPRSGYSGRRPAFQQTIARA